MNVDQEYYQMEFDLPSSTLLISINRLPDGVKWKKDFERRQIEFVNSIKPRPSRFFVILDASQISEISFDILLFGLINSMRALQAAGLCFEAMIKPKAPNAFLLMSEVIKDLEKHPVGIFESREEAFGFIHEEASIILRDSK